MGGVAIVAKLREKRSGMIASSYAALPASGLDRFGSLIGMSVPNLCDIEKGRKGVSPEKAAQIAKAIGLPSALLVRLSIEESLQAAGLKYKVEIKPAA